MVAELVFSGSEVRIPGREVNIFIIIIIVIVVVIIIIIIIKDMNLPCWDSNR